MRKQEEKFNACLLHETEQEVIDKLNRKIALVHAQRKKGLALMKELMEKKKSSQ